MSEPTETVPWYRSPQVLIYAAGVVTGLCTIARATGHPVPFLKDAAGEALFGSGVVSTVSCVYALYRRFKLGNDPNNPIPKITLTKDPGAVPKP